MPKIEAKDIKVVSAEEADKNCPTMGGHAGTACEVCSHRVIIHCERCRQHRTHCPCTISAMIERHIVENQLRDEEADRLRRLGFKEKQEVIGLWTPPTYG